MQASEITIDLSFTDKQQPHLLYLNLQKAIKALREKVINNRNGQTTYKIIFPEKVKIFYVGEKPGVKDESVETQKGEYFQVTISNKDLYPIKTPNTKQDLRRMIYHHRKSPQEMKKHKLKKSPHIFDFKSTYVQKWCVAQAIGVLVAEQVRFNTMDLIKPEIQQQIVEKFKYLTAQSLYKDFLGTQQKYNIYKNWQSWSLSQNQPPQNVKILVKFEK